MQDYKESHFIVVYNHNTKQWTLDIPTTQARFPDGNVWVSNAEGASWENPGNDEADTTAKAQYELECTFTAINGMSARLV